MEGHAMSIPLACSDVATSVLLAYVLVFPFGPGQVGLTQWAYGMRSDRDASPNRTRARQSRCRTPKASVQIGSPLPAALVSQAWALAPPNYPAHNLERDPASHEGMVSRNPKQGEAAGLPS